jgi:hypothetical protein
MFIVQQHKFVHNASNEHSNSINLYIPRKGLGRSPFIIKKSKINNLVALSL